MKANKIGSNIYRHLGIYIAGIILIPALVLTVSYYKTKIKEEEKFSLFFSTDKLDNEKLHSELNTLLAPFSLKQDYQYCSSPVKESKSQYNADLVNYGISLSDFVFVPSEIATETFLANNTNSFKTYYEDGISYGSEKKVTYAIRVFHKDTKKGYLTSLVNYELDQDYYMCISKNSFHYNNYVNNDKSVLLSFIEWMMNYEKE